MAMRDGRGPRGMGPMTGRGMGDCNSRRLNRREYCRNDRRASGRRPGMGRGNLWVEDYVEEIDDRDFLEREKQAIKSRLEEIEEMLADTEEE